MVALGALRTAIGVVVDEVDLAADDRLDAVLLGRLVELDGAVHHAVVGEPERRLAEGRGNQELMQNHLRYFGGEDGMAESSPPHILKRGEPVLTPPALLVQGALDESLTRMMAEEFVEAYSLAGGVIELGKYPGEPHGFLRQGGPMVERAIAHIKSFIARQL